MSDALKDLIAAVEAGLPSPTNWRNFAAVQVGDDDNPGPILANRAYHGSLDAAKGLHDVLLPGWRISDMCEADNTASGWCVRLTMRIAAAQSISAFDQPNTGRAWLLAILRAYEATHDR